MINRCGNLRTRFALWTAGLLLVALLLFGLFVYANMSHSLVAMVDETLHAVATQLLDEDEQHGLIALDDIIEEPQYERLREQGFSLRVMLLNGQVIQSYGPYQHFPQPAMVAFTSPQPDYMLTESVPASLERFRVYTTQIQERRGRPRILQVAQNLDSVHGTLNLLLITLLIGVPLIVIVAGCGGYFLAARALTPIAEMTQMAHDISAQDLSARLNLPKTDDEVGRLAVTLDSMLDRLDRAFRRERQFTADASHELRTPLSALQMIIDSTLTQPRTTAEYVQALTDLRHEAELMKSLTEGLLDLAHSDAADPLIAMEPIQIAVLLNDVVESFQPMAEEKGLVLHNYVVDGKTTVLGDSDALIRLFVNLLDNAIKYTVRGSITVCAQRNVDHSYVIKIQDTGPGIPAEHLPHLFDRFYRVDKARSQHGIGLGLAIARSITYAHGGEITVESVVGQGTNFMVYLRVAAHGALTEQ